MVILLHNLRFRHPTVFAVHVVVVGHRWVHHAWVFISTETGVSAVAFLQVAHLVYVAVRLILIIDTRRIMGLDIRRCVVVDLRWWWLLLILHRRWVHWDRSDWIVSAHKVVSWQQLILTLRDLMWLTLIKRTESPLGLLLELIHSLPKVIESDHVLLVLLRLLRYFGHDASFVDFVDHPIKRIVPDQLVITANICRLVLRHSLFQPVKQMILLFSIAHDMVQFLSKLLYYHVLFFD